jgi:hypothetical protein
MTNEEESMEPPRPEEPRVRTIDLTPFGIIYDLADGVGTPTSESYSMTIDVTTGYLNTYMSLQYEERGLGSFETSATATIYRDGVPQIDFIASARFRSLDPPDTETLDDNVANAFSGANLALYLSMLQNLPEGNAFRTATGARLTNPANLGRGRTSFIGSVSTAGKAGIAASIGAGGLILLALGMLVYGKKRKPHHLLSARARENSNKAAPRSLIQPSEQATVMGEITTCTASSVGSETSSSVRIPSSITHRKAQNVASSSDDEDSDTDAQSNSG